MKYIASVWVCDSGRYPALEGMTTDQRRNFLVKHSLLHIGKTTGKIAAVCENFDHVGQTDGEDSVLLQDTVVKLFINTLKLAEEVGLSADDLLVRAPQFVK